MVHTTQYRLGGRANIVLGDAEKMPFESAQFDVVCCNMSFHHYPHPEKAFAEMFRILKPNGHLLLNDMTGWRWLMCLMNWSFPFLRTGDVKVYRKDEVLSLLSQAGFAIRSFDQISFFSFLCAAQKGEQ